MARTQFPPGWARFLRKKAWYAELNAHDDFLAALQGMYTKLDALLGEAPRRWRAPLTLPAGMPEWLWRQRIGDERADQQGRAWELICGFTERWYLPSDGATPDGAEDVDHSYQTRCWPFYAGRGHLLRIGRPGVMLVPKEFRAIDSRIAPAPVPAFEYDPVASGQDREWLEQRITEACGVLRADILAQAEKIEQAAIGADADPSARWAPPPAYFDDETLRSNARLLYAYVSAPPALRTWGSLARDAGRLGLKLSRSAVQHRVETYAGGLGIPLPARKS